MMERIIPAGWIVAPSGLAEDPSNETAKEGARNAEHTRHDNLHLLRFGRDQADNSADDHSDDEHPKVVQHQILPCDCGRGVQLQADRLSDAG